MANTHQDQVRRTYLQNIGRTAALVFKDEGIVAPDDQFSTILRILEENREKPRFAVLLSIITALLS